MTERYRKILKFLSSGISAAIVEYSLFTLLLHFKVAVVIANTLSFAAGLVVSFTLNKTWVFSVGGNSRVQFVKYSMLAAVNLAISNILIFYGTYSLKINELVVKLLVMVAIAAWNYVIFSKIIFRK